MVLQALVALAVASEGPPPQVPWYVPREAQLGVGLGDLVSAQARLSWEPELISTPIDAFIATLEIGGGNAIPPAPAPLVNSYAYGASLGLGYRSTLRSDFHWGFNIGTGPIFYGGKIGGGPTENFVTGIVDGGLQIGVRINDIRWGLQVRYSEPFSVNQRSIAGEHLGGFYFGIFANWR